MSRLRHEKGSKKISDKSVKHSASHNSAKGMSPVGGGQGNKNVLAEAKKGLACGGHIAGGDGGKLGRKRAAGGKVGADTHPFSSAASGK